MYFNTAHTSITTAKVCYKRWHKFQYTASQCTLLTDECTWEWDLCEDQFFLWPFRERNSYYQIPINFIRQSVLAPTSCIYRVSYRVSEFEKCNLSTLFISRRMGYRIPYDDQPCGSQLGSLLDFPHWTRHLPHLNYIPTGEDHTICMCAVISCLYVISYTWINWFKLLIFAGRE